jgi:hypothetical protein
VTEPTDVTIHLVPTAECCCGAESRQVPLPADLAALSGRKAIWVHAGNGDTRCYPESSSPEDACPDLIATGMTTLVWGW